MIDRTTLPDTGEELKRLIEDDDLYWRIEGDRPWPPRADEHRAA